MSVPIPDTHLDLLNEPIHGVLSTLMPDGQPQSSIVWTDYDGTYVLINTTLERQKGRNMCSNPKVALLVIDPKDVSRWIEVRGNVVKITRDGAVAHADKLTQRFTGKQRFYGDIYPVDQQQKETRVIIKIEPLKISLDAIFK
ncbi:MAG TPA: PPOX class F420-dependent oxidoreductase [Ktedonobacteraceae bacterium]|nr:PPOX class F420-dependent oxidoreductase [Ktedonobacteraceae bacterium]HXZ05931.1 PPOX class F420-dependent oxidoreductase [Ktedonobacteraceae bacterium]